MQDALKDFVLQERKRGVSDSDITHALQGAGWQVADIEMALATLPSTPASTWRMGVLAIGGIVAIAFLATLIFLMFRAPSATSTGGTARTVVAPVASASPQDVSPPVSVAQSTTTSQSTPTANTFALTSIFLKDDPTAQRIATGAQSSVDIRTFSLKIGDATAVGTDSFAYRLVSALRMLGYVPGSAGGQYMSESLLFPFERDNNLPVSDMVNAQVLKTLDAELAVRETKDAQLSAQ
ncbi:MAG TPA: hypothetical protein PLW99_02165, partial [Candidatus Paceibacterota bacterium]|nr:hypothetical protein [Candidatus Paceibacterota bacterium]